jgi:hypothetical protein
MNTSSLTPREFSEAWGVHGLVRLPAEGALPVIPADAARFLVEAGLPAHFVLAHPTLPSEVAFTRLSRGLTPLLAEPTVGPELPKEWSPYLVLGDEEFDNGGAWYCIHQDAGHVVRIDPERDDSVSLVNTTVPRFATAMLMATSWSAGLRASSSTPWHAVVSRLEASLRALDPSAFDAESSRWRTVVRGVADEEPGAFRILGVPRLEGAAEPAAAPDGAPSLAPLGKAPRG